MYSDGRKRDSGDEESYTESSSSSSSSRKGGSSRRARSRSSERERRRDRSRSRERRGGGEGDKEREERYSRRSEDTGRSREGRGRDYRRADDHRHGSEPRDGTVLLLSKITKDTRKEDISRAIGGEISYVKEIRIIQKDGYDANCAFVEFYSSKDTARWMEQHKESFTVRGRLVAVEYGHSRRGGGGGEVRHRGTDERDWVCFKCDTMNFAWRRVCMTCDCSKSESEKLHEDVRQGRIACPQDSRRESDDRNNPPCNVLIFRGLDALTTEDSVAEAVSRLSSLPLKDLRLIRDKLTNTSRGFCFVELNSTEDATELLAAISNEYPAFFIGGRRITVNFARPNNPADVTVNKVASAAIEQAQWSMNPLSATKHVKPIVHQPIISKTAAQAYQQDPKPSRVERSVQPEQQQQQQQPEDSSQQLPSTYSYDATSGYYYDSATSLYYDPKTKYHYNSKTQQYCYFDATSQSYIPVNNDGKAVAAPAATAATGTKVEGKTKKDSTGGSGVSAKKIAKDMKRWAKSVNAAKATQQQQLQIFSQPSQQPVVPDAAVPQPVGLSTVAASAGAGCTQDVVVRTGIALSAALKTEEEKPVLSTQAADIPVPADPAPFVPNMNPAHTDWKQLACLLCQRKFGSREVLIKHQQFSDLHKQNLAKEKQKTSDEELQYRDRAKERRAKHGTPAIIPGWKKKLEREMHSDAPIAFEQPVHVKEGLKEDNIGNKLLQAMGWNEGQGLGKSNQGITQPIEASMRQASAGLGAPGSNYGSLYNSSGNYKDTLRSLTHARYHNQFN